MEIEGCFLAVNIDSFWCAGLKGLVVSVGIDGLDFCVVVDTGFGMRAKVTWF